MIRIYVYIYIYIYTCIRILGAVLSQTPAGLKNEERPEGRPLPPPGSYPQGAQELLDLGGREPFARGGGRVLLTEILLPRIARQGTVCLISKRG